MFKMEVFKGSLRLPMPGHAVLPSQVGSFFCENWIANGRVANQEKNEFLFCLIFLSMIPQKNVF